MTVTVTAPGQPVPGELVTLKTSSPHVRPGIAAAIGVAAGVLTLVQAYFGSGHLPSSAEVASVVGGSGLTAASVLGFIAHHASWLKTVGPVVAAELPAIEATIGQVPGLQAELEHLKTEMVAAVQTEVSKVVPDVDVAALTAEIQKRILATLASAATAVPPPAA